MNNGKILAIVALVGMNGFGYGMNTSLRPFTRVSALFQRVLYGKPHSTTQFDMVKLQEEAKKQDERWTDAANAACHEKASRLLNALTIKQLLHVTSLPQENRQDLRHTWLLEWAQDASKINLTDEHPWHRKTIEYYFNEKARSAIDALVSYYGVTPYSKDETTEQARVKNIVDCASGGLYGHYTVHLSDKTPFGVIDQYALSQDWVAEQRNRDK